MIFSKGGQTLVNCLQFFQNTKEELEKTSPIIIRHPLHVTSS